MVRVKATGRIIRILDPKTVIINLGSEDGISSDSIFYILGEPEDIVDPQTNEVLGSVKATKGRVRASTVSEKFTIATTSWSESAISASAALFPLLTTRINEGDLKVDLREIKPWKSRSE